MTTEQMTNDVTGCIPDDPWGEKEPWVIHREQQAAEQKAAEEEAARHAEERREAARKAAWVDMTKSPNEWVQVVNSYDISDGAVRVAIALASYGGNGNTQGIFPTIETLTAKMPKSRSAIDRGIKALKGADLIREQHRAYNGPVTYRLGALPEIA